MTLLTRGAGAAYIPSIAAFVPSSISGLVLWLDANVGVTHVANAISDWADQSGSANNATQATAAQKPTLGTDSVTGRKQVTFDGANRMQIIDSNSLDLTTGMSVFIAANIGTLVTYAYFMSKDSTTGLTAYGIYCNAGPTDIRFNINGTEADVKTGGTLTGRHLLAGIYDKVNVQGRWDKAATASTALTADITTNAVDLWIGDARSIGGNGFTGNMFEVLIYNSGLSNADRDSVETYLRDRWSTT